MKLIDKMFVPVLMMVIALFMSGCGDNKKTSCLNGAIDLSCCKVKESFWTSGYVRFEFKRLGTYQVSCETQAGKLIQGPMWNFTYSATNLQQEVESGGLASGCRLGDLPPQPMVVVLKDVSFGKTERHLINLDDAYYDDDAPSADHGGL